MTARDFRTAADAREARRAAAERDVERVKRAVEDALVTYSDGAREQDEILRYCRRIGLELNADRRAAGLEFIIDDLEDVADKLRATPMPASLQRFAG